MTERRVDRLDELLVARATEGLTVVEERELEQLLASQPEVDRNGYERAAAAVCLAVLGAPAVMPRGLRERLARSAESFAAQLPQARR
jgi:hypothetical protein